ncbi:MAG: protein-tyrosine phosphatase family protein [Acidimicrobiales bacterium]
MTPWPPGPGVVELPDERRVRGRGLRTGTTAAMAPDMGCYLLGRAPAPTPWPAVWVRWSDFGLPAEEASALAALAAAFDQCAEQRVEVACRGGRGRTGCALAVLAVLSGVPAADAVSWVRAVYHPRAVETPWQRRWVRGLDADRIRAAR